MASSRANAASVSDRSLCHGRSVRPAGRRRPSSSAGKRPVSAPASTAMFATARRSSIVSASAPSPTNSSTAFVPPPTPISASTARMRSLPVTNRPFSPVKVTRIVAGTACQNSPSARQAAMSVEPEPGAERPECPVRARVRVAAGDHRARHDPALLAQERVLDAAAALAVERHALSVRPVLEALLQLGRARVLRGHEVVGDHHHAVRVEDPLDAHPLERSKGDRPADVVRHHEIAAEHDDVAGTHVGGVGVSEDDLLSQRVWQRAPPDAPRPRRCETTSPYLASMS